MTAERTDRELLVLAAKAEGREIGFSSDGECRDVSRLPPQANFLAACPWNPLNNDGDALRLAVTLQIGVTFGANYVIAGGHVQVPAANNAGDPHLAVRHAIVRAAAAMADKCPHCRDNTHYRIEGDGIAVLRPETLAGCPKFRHELDRAAMAEGGEQ